ncbi:hypothetical protein E1A91_D13G110600v1 [Gossypium mustelinum]|uniref:Small auxin-up RNA n=1 Tax=Gossypium mustelinum TaxID=34275 RepID=A0A5D2S0J2_GOSMU|nr:hypothetical protein E1A91_D13G110600v1 [Gossypium mustelinum]
MGFCLPRIVNSKPSLKRSLLSSETTKKKKKRFVVPLPFLKHPSFQNLLSQAKYEFHFNHPMSALIIPCNEEAFINITCNL